MALDALEKDRLRQRMATRMQVFTEGFAVVSCVSAHYYDEPHPCELCQEKHGEQVLVVKNRAGKKMVVALECLKEMIRFKVVEVEELTRWVQKFSELRAEHKKRKELAAEERREEVKRLERKVIVRRKGDASSP